MAGARLTASLAMVLLATAACQSSKDDDLSIVDRTPTATARATRLQREMADHDSTAWRSAPLARWVLPRELREISGLTLTQDGRLLAEADEVGKVWEIDYRRGILVKRFALGNGGVHGDFEAITSANNLLYLFTSKGKLYEFHEGQNHADVGYETKDTHLGNSCEFEGAAFDSTLNSLVLACKTVYDSTIQNSIVLYRWQLAHDAGQRLSRLVVPIASVIGTNDWKTFHPSDITIDPFTGDYVLIASKERALIEITPNGAPVLARPLPPDHIQAEGVAITKDSILIISDEGGGDLGMITLYKWP